MKQPRKPIDPYEIYKHASWYHECDHRLRNTVPANDPNQIPIIHYPSLTLSAFASELYFKCLLTMEGKTFPPIHNLKKLFKLLNGKTQTELERSWAAYCALPQRAAVLAHIKTLPDGQGFRDDLLYSLGLGANAFEDIRYFYEKKSVYFLLGDLPDLIRAIILARHPEWTAIPIPPSQPIGQTS